LLSACYPGFDVERQAEHTAAMPEPRSKVSAGAGGAEHDGGAAGQAGADVVVAGGAGTTGTADCQRGQALLSGYVENVRDLGAIPVAGGAVACGAIYRGGPLKNLLAQGCEQVATLGVKTILDLRMPSEQSSNPTSACVSAERVSAPLPIPYGLGRADYLADFNEVASIAKAFHTFGDPAAYPIYFHCTFGRDRTGVLGALLLSTLGASRDDIVADYMLSQETVGAYPDSLAAVLDEIAARGGAEAVLTALGITPDELAVLRSHVAPAP
jgi:protein-tyrosine phosphatase